MLEKLDRVLERLARLSIDIGCVAVVGILVLLAGSSVKRYVLGTPIPVTEELAGLLFVAVSFCSIPYGFCAKQQIRVLAVWRRLPPRLAAWAAVAGDFASIAVVGLIIQSLYEFTALSRAVDAKSAVSDITLWPWMALMMAMLGLLALVLASRTLLNLRDALAGRPVVLVEGKSVD